MASLNRFSLKARLYFLVVLMSLGLSAVAISGKYISTHLGDVSNEITDQDIPSLEACLTMELYLTGQADDLGSYLASRSEVHLGKLKESREKYEKARSSFNSLNLGLEEKQLLSDVDSSYKEYVLTVQKVIEHAQANRLDEANKLSDTALGSIEDKIFSDLGKVEMINKRIIQSKSIGVDELVESSNFIFLVLPISTLLIGILFGIVVIRSIVSTLGAEPSELEKEVRRIASGDLTNNSRLNIPPSSVLDSVDAMRQNFSNMVQHILSRSQTLAETSNRLTTKSKDVLEATTNQSHAVSSMAAAMEEMVESITQVAENANSAQINAAQSGELSNTGANIIHDATDEIRVIAGTVTQATSEIQNLKEQTLQISSIVSVIKDIADQTNLLALNAAIEAARAGEQGRGFAVVADEVRKLAERTAQSTQEIAFMIESVNQGTEKAVSTMEAGNQSVNLGVIKAGNAAEAINQIKNSSHIVLVAVNEISSALEEQRSTTQVVANNAEHVSHLNEQNLHSVQAVSSEADEVMRVSEQLNEAARQFRL